MLMQFKPNDKVVFKQLPCIVNQVNPDGTLHLIDGDGDDYDNISPDDVEREADVKKKKAMALAPALDKNRVLVDSISNLPEMRGLSAFERRFVEEFVLEPWNNTAAYYRAGGAARTYGGARLSAHNLAHRPQVAAALAVVMDLLSASVKDDRDKLMRDLLHQYDVAMAAVPVIDADGNPTGVYKVNGAVAIKAWEMRARLMGELRDKIEVTGKDGSPIQHQHQHLHAVTVFGEEQLAKLTPARRLQLLEIIREMKQENPVVDGRPVENSLGSNNKETNDAERDQINQSNPQGRQTQEAIADAATQGPGDEPEGHRRGEGRAEAAAPDEVQAG